MILGLISLIIMMEILLLMINVHSDFSIVMSYVLLSPLFLILYQGKIIGKVFSIGILEFETNNILIQTKEVVKNISINDIDQVILCPATGKGKYVSSASTYIFSIRLKNGQIINLHIRRKNIANTSSNTSFFYVDDSDNIMSKLNNRNILWKYGRFKDHIKEATCIRA